MSEESVTVEDIVSAMRSLLEAVKLLRDIVYDLQDRVDLLESEIRHKRH